MAPIRAVLLVAVGLIGWGETGRLVSGALTGDDPAGSIEAGRSGELGEVSGPLALSHRDVWEVWSATPQVEQVAVWLGLAVLFDALLVTGYGWLLFRFLRPTGSGTARAAVRHARLVLTVLLGVEAFEAALTLAGAVLLAGAGVPGWFTWVPACTATVKWVAVAVLLLVVLRDRTLRRRIVAGLGLAARALLVQRLSLVIVGVFAVLALVPAPGIFDQFPDVLRSWFDLGDGPGTRHAFWGLALAMVVAAALFVLGRLRTERAWTTRVGNPDPTPPTQAPEEWWWLVGPVAAGVAVVWLRLTGSGDLVHAPTVWWVLALPAAVLVLSWGLRRWAPGWLTTERRSRRTEQGIRRAFAVWVAGDVLALGLLLVGALAVVRALVAPVLLGAGDEREVTWGIRLAVLLLAVAALLVLPAVAARALSRLETQPVTGGLRGRWLRMVRPREHSVGGPLGQWGAVAVWAVGIGVLLALMIWPIQVSGRLGVVGTVLLALGGWLVVLGFLVVHMQHQQPMAVFRVRPFALRANPVLSLLLVVAFIASLNGGDEDLHEVRDRGDSVGLPGRVDLAAAFDSWLAERTDCVVPVGDGREVLPMVLVGASGGGIRAATWTALVLGEVAGEGRCGASSVFLSSGVSGGSVGLAVSREGDAADVLGRLAAPDGLAAALAGTLVGDLVAGNTGIRLPSRLDGRVAWRDRAGLMEEIWERDSAALAASWSADVSGPGGVLVLNSTAAGLGCRVLVSQVRVDAGTDPEDAARDDRRGAPQDPECRAGTGQPAVTMDLQDTFRRCTPRMTWATAAMLSARFPTVTPAGRVPGSACADGRDLQLVDGGYAESSGLGTLADLSSDVMQLVRTRNARDDVPPVLPLVLYLEDEPRTDIVAESGQLTPELFVPLVGGGAAAEQVSTSAWLQRLSDDVAAPCPPGPAGSACTEAVAAADDVLAGQVVVAAPPTRPSVEAPLGWTLSPDSWWQLRLDLRHQAEGCAATPTPGGYPCLADLLAFLDAGS